MSQFKLLVQLVYPHSAAPFKKHHDDAGYDLFSAQDYTLSPGQTVKLDCGIKIAIPEGWHGHIVPRSSWRSKGLLCQSIYDTGYRGLVQPFITNVGDEVLSIKKGERVVQLVPIPVPVGESIEVVDFLPEHARGENGVGSTGRF